MNSLYSAKRRIVLNRTALSIMGAVLVFIGSTGVQAQEVRQDRAKEAFGKVFIKSSMPNVKVYIDGVYKGPVNSTILSVRAGKRAISCQSGGVSISGVFMVKESTLNQWEARFDEGRFVPVLEKKQAEAAAAKQENTVSASAEVKLSPKEAELNAQSHSSVSAAAKMPEPNVKSAMQATHEGAVSAKTNHSSKELEPMPFRGSNVPAVKKPDRKSIVTATADRKNKQQASTKARKEPPARIKRDDNKGPGETWAVVIYFEKIGPTFSTVLFESSAKGTDDALEKTKTACEQHAKKSLAFTYACEPIGTCSGPGWFAVASNVRGGGTAKFSCNKPTEDEAIEAAKKACGAPACAKVFSHEIKR